VTALVLREMATTYGRSPGGYLWAILEPIAAISLMSILFSLLLRAPSLGTNFPLFYATGFLPFGLYMVLSTTMAASIRFSRALLTYPAVTFMDALIARFLLNALTQFLVMTIVFVGIIVAYDLKLVLDWTAICLAVAMAMAMGIGVGTLNCYLISSFPLWERLWLILNRPAFLISAILFIPENVPTAYRDWLMLNPLAHVTTMMRKGFYTTYPGSTASPSYVFIIALVLTVFGLVFLLRRHKDIMHRLA
jgi:capsular polysaccharide transport system permease protein